MRYRLDTGCFIDQETGEILTDVKVRNRLNEQDKRIRTLQNYSDRKREENRRIHNDFDKLWEICKDKGMTEDELIKELEQ